MVDHTALAPSLVIGHEINEDSPQQGSHSLQSCL